MRFSRLQGMVVLAAAVLLAQPAAAATYTSGSTPYNFIDSSAHSKIGYNTAPYKFNGSSGCGTTPPTLDDTLSDAIPIGFSFTFGIGTYTSAYVMSNGRLQFGNTSCGFGTSNIGPPQTYPNAYPDASFNATMKVFGVDLDPTNLVDKPNYPSAGSTTPCLSTATCYVSVATIGVAPSRQFVVTWKGVPEWVATNNTSGSFDLQIILNEDGTFVFQYGTISHGGTGTAQIGWQLSMSDYQVLSFGAATEPSPNTAIKFYLPAPLATYSFDENAWAGGVAGQVLDTSASARNGTAVGDAQTSATGHTCRAASIPAHGTGTLNAVKTGLDLSSIGLNMLGTGTIGFWYRSNNAWSGAGASSVQLLDATAVNGQWFFLSKTAAGVLVFEVTDSTGVVRTVSSAAQSFAANTWVHVAVTWDFNGNAGSNQDSLQIFVNAGTPAASAFTSSGTVTAQAGALYVGDNAIGVADTLGSLNSANGFVDEVEVYNYALTQSQVSTVMNTTHSCSSVTIDHLEIQHASGNGVSCTPSTVTVRACANAACSSLYTGGVSGMLAAAGSPTVNWDGSTGYASGSGFVIASGSSSVSKSFQVTTVGTVSLSNSGNSPSVTNATSCNFGSPSCSFATADSGFIFSVPHHVADSAQTVSVSAVKTSTGSLACTPAFASVSKSVSFTCSTVNPAAGTLPVRVGGVALNSSNSSAAACGSSGAAVSLAFNASGVASTTVQYADVGSVNLAARYAPTSGTEAGLVMTGASAFVARPAGFGISSVRCFSMGTGQCAPALASPGNNPAAASASGGAFIPAGRRFTATVSALNSSGAVTPNFGRETSPEGVTLTPNLVLPAGGVAGALSNGSIGGASFTSGAATLTTLSYSEVGIITLSAVLTSGSYLSSGAVGASTSVNIGRFVPAQFVLSGGSVTHRTGLSCSPASAFSYLGENFRLGFTLTAQNAAGATTSNYTSTFAKLDPTSASGWNLAGLGGTTTFSVASGRLSLGSAAGSFASGVASGVTITANASRAATPDGPFSTAFGVAPTDSDGVTMAAYDLASTSGGGNDRTSVATVPLRFGRLRLSNAMGAADRALSLPAAAQYWTGTAWDTNTLDSCTTVATTAVNFGNPRKTMVLADMVASAGITFASGLGTLKLAAPVSGHSGTVDVALSLGSSATDASCLQTWTPTKAATVSANLAHLRGAWCGSTYDKDAAARASFGLQRTQENQIYRRENY